RVVQGVEGNDEFFLFSFSMREQLDIVDPQHIDIAELVAEASHLVVAQRVDHLVGNLLAGEIADRGLRLVLLHHVPNGLHQVRFPHAYPTIEEEWVISHGWTLRHSLSGSKGELIAAADD